MGAMEFNSNKQMTLELPWENARSDACLVRQWQRRFEAPLPFILEEVQRRMISRARIIRPTEGPLVIHGWLHKSSIEPLAELFPGRFMHVVSHAQGIELSANPGLAGRAFELLRCLIPPALRTKRIQSGVLVCSPGHGLPLESSSSAMVWSPLWLQSVQSPAFLLDEWFRVLKLQGGVFFSALGPDTAQLLRKVANSIGLPFPDFMDMHDLGDLMARRGFSDPVMEMEKLRLSYSEVSKLLHEWRDLFGNNLKDRRPGLSGRGLISRILAELESHRDASDGKVLLELELIYGHAWKVRPKMGPGEAVVSLSSLKRAPKD